MALFSLADRMGKTVIELEQTMPVAELIEWFAYFEIKSKKT